MSLLGELRDHFKEFTGLAGCGEGANYSWTQKDIDFTVKYGETVGRNDWGKSTLPNILLSGGANE